MAATFTALYDANVLYPASLRDLLMRLALEDIFLARWTDEIHDEWIRNVLETLQLVPIFSTPSAPGSFCRR